MGLYRYMPAGLRWENKGGFAIYVRYRGNSNNLKILWHNSTSIRIQCPDRDLLIVRNTNTSYPLYPAESWDELICVDPFHHHVYKEEDIPFYMVNYTDYFNSPDGGARIRNNFVGIDGTKVVSDSGGHQIAMGVCDYVDPRNLINWYNSNVDLGLVLDIPLKPSIVGQDIFIKSAKIQRKNTEILLKHKRKDLELINIFQGETPEDIRNFRDIVEDDKITRLAIGGTRRGALLPSLNKIIPATLDGKIYNHYHVLGMLAAPIAAMLSYYVRHPKIKLITSDSSSPIQAAVTGTYFLNNLMEKPFSSTLIGFMGKYNNPSTSNVLPCQCPVCSAIKYSDVFGVLGKSILFEVLSYHNLHIALNYTKTLFDVINGMDYKQTKEFLTLHYTGNKKKDDVLVALDFVEEVLNNGVKKAQHKFKYYLDSTALFNDADMDSMFDGANEIEEASTKMTPERAKKIFKIFESGKGKQTKVK